MPQHVDSVRQSMSADYAHHGDCLVWEGDFPVDVPYHASIGAPNGLHFCGTVDDCSVVEGLGLW